MITQAQYQNLQSVRRYLQPLMNQLVGLNYYFYGGCVRDLYMGNKPNDFDIGCNDRKQLDSLVERLKKVGYRIEIITDFGYKMRYLNNFIDISNWQLLTLEEKLHNFDFTINTIGIDNNYRCVFHKSTLDDIDNKHLKEVIKDGGKHRPDIHGRFMKFWDRGFSFKNEEYKQTVNLDLVQIDVEPFDWADDEYDIRNYNLNNNNGEIK